MMIIRNGKSIKVHLGARYFTPFFDHLLFHRYWVFRSWGRINENIGDKKLEAFDEKSKAIENFEDVYFKKTGNHIKDKAFVKTPEKYYEVPHSRKPIRIP